MPRIEDRLLKAVVYLYQSEGAAGTGAPGGSGFLVGEPCANPEAVFLFAVTNAHVAWSCPVVRTAGPHDKRIFVRTWGDWYQHDDGDDVVVTPIGFAPKDDRDFHLGYVPREWFVTPENFIRASDACWHSPRQRIRPSDTRQRDTFLVPSSLPKRVSRPLLP